jgi:hypothetical protein
VVCSYSGVLRLMGSSQLRDKDMSAEDERKILAMREFIFKQAHAARG